MSYLPQVFYPFLIRNEDGKELPSNCEENLEAILHAHQITAFFNVIKNREEAIIPDVKSLPGYEGNTSINSIISLCGKHKFHSTYVKNFMFLICQRNWRNPVAEWLGKLNWDGTSRMQALCDTVKTQNPEDEAFKNTLIRKWIIQAVAAGVSPAGLSSGGCLVFLGKQGVGKSRWFKRLVPESMSDYLKDGVILEPGKKDSVEQTVCNWLVELGELDGTLRKADIAQLKAFLTLDRDVYRPAYAVGPVQVPRRTVFFASVNNEGFLRDATGNRRFWTVETAAIDHGHSIDMSQLWAEAYSLFQAGEGYRLLEDEIGLLGASNERHTPVSGIEQALADLFPFDPGGDGQYGLRLTATEIMKRIGYETPKTSDFMQMNQAYRKLSTLIPIKSEGKTRYWLPEPRVSAVGGAPTLKVVKSNTED